MGIFDEAIKEHLELKRRHGAGDSELKQLEDEAFGPPERPGGEAADSLGEAPTEFMDQPEAAEEQPARRRGPDIADLQEAPEPESEPVAREDEPTEEEPAEEEQPAMEHEAIVAPDEAIAEPQPSAPPTTDERQAISEEPTQLYDVEGELASGTETEEAAEEEASDEEEADEEDDDFFDEQRLSDELDQALEGPEGENLDPEGEPQSGVPDREGDLEREDDLEPGKEPAPQGSDEDLLEETPDFLEETPEDDQLWFEQKPPKDFDFDD